MKNIINLFALVLCFTFLAATTTNAQSEVRNETDCEFVLRVEYGTNCVVQGRISVVAQPMAITVLPIPSNTEVISAKGAYNTSSLVNCPFLVVAACAGTPQSQNITCSVECEDYSVVLNNTGSIRIFQ